MNWIRAIPIVVLFSLGICSNAFSQAFTWDTQVANYKYSVTFGTIDHTVGIESATTVVAAATVTTRLQIPERSTSANINIRAGTAVIYWATTTISGNITSASVAIGIFDSPTEADFYVTNHVSIGDVPQYRVPIGDTSVTYAACNIKTQFEDYGYYTVPLTKSSRSMVIWVFPTSDGLSAINQDGFTIEVLFNRE